MGDEPAVTKARQKVTLKNGMTLSDNPGILRPKIEDSAASFRLAFGGAIPDTAIDYESVALFGAAFLLERYPDLLRARYKLTELPASASALLVEIGKRRGGLRSGGVVDVHKAADVLVHDFRSGALGRIKSGVAAGGSLPPRALTPGPSPIKGEGCRKSRALPLSLHGRGGWGVRGRGWEPGRLHRNRPLPEVRLRQVRVDHHRVPFRVSAMAASRTPAASALFAIIIPLAPSPSAARW